MRKDYSENRGGFPDLEPDSDIFYLRFGRTFANEIPSDLIPDVTSQGETQDETHNPKSYERIYKEGAFKLLQEFLQKQQYQDLWAFFCLAPTEKLPFYENAYPRVAEWVGKTYMKEGWEIGPDFSGWSMEQITNLVYKALEITTTKNTQQLNLQR